VRKDEYGMRKDDQTRGAGDTGEPGLFSVFSLTDHFGRSKDEVTNLPCLALLGADPYQGQVSFLSGEARTL